MEENLGNEADNPIENKQESKITGKSH